MLVKYKDSTGNIISDSESFASQFRLQHCEELELETVERMVYIISKYITEEEGKAHLSIMSYNNYYSSLAGQKYEETDIERGVKFCIIARLNDIYACTSLKDRKKLKDAQNTILNSSFKLMEQTSDSGEEVWVESILTTNRYLSPLLHLLGIKQFNNITDFISSERFPENYPLEQINSIFKEMFYNIREATIRNLNTIKIEGFTPEQKSDTKLKKVIADALNKGIQENPIDIEDAQREPKVRFDEEPRQIKTYSYKLKNKKEADVIYSYRKRNIIHSDDKENIDNSRKRNLPQEGAEKPSEKRFVARLLKEREDIQYLER